MEHFKALNSTIQQSDSESESEINLSESEGQFSTPSYSLRKRNLNTSYHYDQESKISKTTPNSEKLNWYQKVKQSKSPEDFKQWQKGRSNKLKEYRKSLTPTRKKSFNEKSRLRMQNLREKRKNDGSHSPKKKKVLTRRELDKKREKWRLAKRKVRAKMSVQQVRRENEKRRESYRDKSKRKLVYADDDADSFAKAIAELVENATPKKKRALVRKGLVVKLGYTPSDKIIADTIKLNLNLSKKDMSNAGRKKTRILLNAVRRKGKNDAFIRKRLAVSLHSWKRATLLDEDVEPVLKKFTTDEEKEVKNFYVDNSTEIPDKEGKGRSILQKPFRELHEEFVRERFNISIGTFHKLKPEKCINMSHNKFITCLCEYCVNIDLLVKSLSRYNILPEKAVSKYDVLNMTLCQDLDVSNMGSDQFMCIERKCMSCGIKKLLDQLNHSDENIQIKYDNWVTANSTTLKGKKISRKILKPFEVEVDKVVKELCRQLESFPHHIFVAAWQKKSFQNLKQNLKAGFYLSIVDFSENYRCMMQNEIASAYYSYEQATLHTSVGYYLCTDEDCNELVTEYMTSISHDLVHDAYAAEQFIQINRDHIISKRGVKIEREFTFSDGCKMQYKSKVPFYQISEKDPQLERSFYGSRHGKNACDPLGGLVKSKAEMFVKTGGIIQNAKDLFTFASNNLTVNEKHMRRTFFYVDISRDSKSNLKLVPLKGTANVHSIKPTGVNGQILYRNLSCFCDGCLSNGTCLNKGFVTQFKAHNLLKKNCQKNQVDKKTEKKEGKTTTKNPKGKPMLKEPKANNKDKKVNTNATKAKKADMPVKTTSQKPNNIKTVESAKTAIKKKGMYSVLSQANTFEELNPIAEYLYQSKFTNVRFYDKLDIVSLKKSIDAMSMELMPSVIPHTEENLFPIVIGADGNCLPRCGSVIIYGKETNHREVRARMTVELVRNKEFYLNDPQTSLLHASLSAHFKPNEALDPATIERVFERSVMHSACPNKYMEIWHLQALSNVTHHSIVSVYPEYGGHTLRSKIQKNLLYPNPEGNHMHAYSIILKNYKIYMLQYTI